MVPRICFTNSGVINFLDHLNARMLDAMNTCGDPEHWAILFSLSDNDRQRIRPAISPGAEPENTSPYAISPRLAVAVPIVSAIDLILYDDFFEKCEYKPKVV